jgi:aspartate/methionine/tyrosine aminotransferase
MRLNPEVEATPSYPFVRLAALREQARQHDPGLIDLSVGEPRDPTAPIVREALQAAAASVPLAPYPKLDGLPELRAAIASWAARRHDVTLDPDREIVPTLGSKEPIAQVGRLFAERGDAVAVTSPGYPVPERSARMAGLRVHQLVLSQSDGWLPDPDAVPWDDVAVLWITTPHNPTGAVAPLELLEILAERCRRHGAILAVDEAYSELWADGDAPPPSALQLADRTGVVVFNSLSKRSGVPGLRSGFAAGDEQIVGRLKRQRAVSGTTPPLFVQQASIAIWSDEQHVSAARERYAAKRVTLGRASALAGLEPVGGPAGMFLWLRTPDPDEHAMQRLVEQSLLTMPGSFLGNGGEGHLRVALTPPADEVERAVVLLRSLPAP